MKSLAWLIGAPVLLGLVWSGRIAAQEEEESMSSLSAAEVVQIFGSSVVLIQAEQPNGKTAVGSGFFVELGGVIATSLHVVDGAESVVIRIEGERFEANHFLAFDIERDLVLLQIDSEEFEPVVLGETSALTRGDKLYVISNPLGLAGTVSDGLVGAWRDPSRELADDHEAMARLGGLPQGRLLQISASVSPGSSGAPVFDEYGYVVGVVAAGVGAGTLDLNFAIPVEALTPLLGAGQGWDLPSLQRTLDRRRRDLAEPHLVDARFHIENGDLDQAALALQRALTLFPRSSQGLTMKGELLVREGRIAEAGQLFRSAVETNSESAEAWENLGRFLVDHGSRDNLSEAVEALERALELEPWLAEAAYSLGVARVLQGRFEQAREALERATESDREHVRAWTALGAVCLELRDLPAAEAALESAIWIDPESAEATCSLAWIFSRTRDQRAAEYRQRCQELAGEDD